MKQQIDSLNEFVQIINSISESLHQDMVRNDKLLFRGQPNKSYALLPSIARQKSLNHQSLVWFEKEMISNAVCKRPDIFGNEVYPINLLTKLQHYGLPTRLLDITYNAFVALYFACSSEENKDGEVIIFQVFSDMAQYMHYYDSVLINVIAQMYKIGKLGGCTLTRYTEIINLDNYDDKKIKNRKEVYEKIGFEISKPLFVVPSNLSERQKHQQGAFIIFPNGCEKTKGSDLYITGDIKALPNDSDLIHSRIVIPSKKKTTFIEQLKSFGITEEFLFPDSTDILCESIKKDAISRME